MNYDNEQIAAIELCLTDDRIVGITGQAGTGKTTIIKEAVRRLRYKSELVCVVAPTGKAAQRISEATGYEALTIHRLLEYGIPDFEGNSYPKRDRTNPIDYDIVFCDEFSMVNQDLYRNLLDALPPGGKLRAFGDLQQLPPIEPEAYKDSPTPFATILAKFPSKTLTTVHRQGEGSGILVAAQRIVKGSIPRPDEKEFFLHISDIPVDIMMNHLRESPLDFSSLDNQIIVPTRKSFTGSVKLNELLQNHYRPESDGWLKCERHSAWKQRQDPSFIPKYIRVRNGDKVIYNKNNYGLNIFNGEIGIVDECDADNNILVVDFGDRRVEIPEEQKVIGRRGPMRINPRKDLELAYVITTHKSQGSEYKNVIYILNTSHSMLRTRRNFYTAVTRARNTCLVISDSKSIGYAVTRTKEGF